LKGARRPPEDAYRKDDAIGGGRSSAAQGCRADSTLASRDKLRYFPEMANTIDLSGRSAVVTGGAQGIGRAIVERLLKSGASVAIWDRDGKLAEQAARELQQHGQIAAFAVDVTKLTEIEA